MSTETNIVQNAILGSFITLKDVTCLLIFLTFVVIMTYHMHIQSAVEATNRWLNIMAVESLTHQFTFRRPRFKS
jgi:hypothetical protein